MSLFTSIDPDNLLNRPLWIPRETLSSPLTEKQADTQRGHTRLRWRSYMIEPGLQPGHICLQTETNATPSFTWDFKSDWTHCDTWLKSCDCGAEGSEKNTWESTLFSVPGETENPACKHQFHQPHLFQEETISWLCHSQFHTPSQKWLPFSAGWEDSRNSPQRSRLIRSLQLIRA